MNRHEKCKIIVLGIFVLIGAGCTSYESKIYEGKVLDEQGTPINNVSIILCYTGWAWDWSMAGGFPLTMGHSFCSDPVVTDQFGNYKVGFAGPPSTFIIARHPDWVQVKDYLAKDNRVVLVRREILQKRRSREAEDREKEFRQRKPSESRYEYYCRVVRKSSNVIELMYHEQRIKVFENLMVEKDKAIFALVGSYDAVRKFANEIIIGEIGLNGVQSFLDNIIALPDTVSCGNEIYFIGADARSDSPFLVLRNSDNAKIEVPSLRAIFALKMWTLE